MIKLFGTSMVSAVGAEALGKIGGTTAAKGQAAMLNVSSFSPVIGSMTGMRMMIRHVPILKQNKRRR